MKVAGATLPLFSIRTARDWGIGEIPDLPACAAWLKRAGHSLLQLLPPHELSFGETSPYGALTAFGIDPIYAGITAIPDLDAASIEEALGEEGARDLERVRSLPHVDYRAVRALKTRALRAAFARFRSHEWDRSSARADELRRFIGREKHWLDDLALYTALRESHGGYGWETWPEDERDRSPISLERARARFATRMLEVSYTQWILIDQWERARAEMRDLGVELMGDLPFVVCGESADVWARASQFQRHMSLGAPPDAFSEDGQNWGLPPYDWLAMEADDLAWVRARTQQATRLYDRFRLDHVVGYFRQWVRVRARADEAPAKGRFDPDGTDAQRARGRRVLGAILEEANGSRVIAEDLGVIPPFVRETLAELKTPGYRVIPWEKDERGHFRDPEQFPEVSVASFSTHDTAPITAWWDDLSGDDRAALARMSHLAPNADDDLRSLALLGALFRSGSELTLVLVQELLGDRERINTPGTVGDENWTYRLPRTIEALESDPRVEARLSQIRKLVTESKRS